MILRKDYVKLIQSGKVQVKAEKTKQHNEMLNIIFQERNYSDCGIIGFFYIFSENHLQGYLASLYPFEDLPIIQAEDIILDNTVIKVESEEQGKKVIEWWKEQGVDVIGYMGTSIGYYYGIFDGQFKICKKDYFIKDKKIITLPETFPEKWYMPITEDNKEVANEWRKGNAKDYVNEKLGHNSYLLSKHLEDNSLFAGISYFRCFQEYYKDYHKITTEEFLEKVYNPWKVKQEESSNKIKKDTMKITPEQAQELIDMVLPSCEWKTRLVQLWANKIVLREKIEISDELLQQGRKDASQSQKEVINRIFGKEKEEIDLQSKKGIGKRKIYEEKGNNDNCLMSLSIISSNNAIHLNPEFKWTLLNDYLVVSYKD
jgi:hypothetical protein